MVITSEEYRVKFKEWLKERYDEMDPKPNGMCGTWAFHIAKEREFKQYLKEQGILVDKEHIRSDT